MRYFLDTEFSEKPNTIELISIGIYSEDGRSLYCVSSEFNESGCSEWVMENVVQHLAGPRHTLAEIARFVLDFIGGDDAPEFWAYYGDYDWVVFCWLFGRMIDLPEGWPKYCRDLKQWCDELGNPKLPEQYTAEHNALNDAKWNSEVWTFLNQMRDNNAK